MFPRKGIVISLSAGMMTVRLQSGAQCCVPNTKGFKLGDTAHVWWDFTHDEPREVLTDVEYHHNPEDEDQYDAVMPGDLLPDEHWA